jgi:hypothetical protein
LPPAADHRRIRPAGRPGGSIGHGQEAVGADRLRLALHGQAVERFGLDRVAHQPPGRLTDDDLAGPGRLLHALGQVDGIAGDEALARSRVTRHDLPGVDADAPTDRRSETLPELGVELRQAVADGQRGTDRT